MGIESVKNSATSYQRTMEAPETKVGATSDNTAMADSTQDKAASIADFAEKNKVEKEEQNQQTVGDVHIKKVVEEINRKAHNSEAIFGIHDATNRVTIKIIDKESKEVLKEYPPEKTLDMIAKVWEMAGLMIDEKR